MRGSVGEKQRRGSHRATVDGSEKKARGVVETAKVGSEPLLGGFRGRIGGRASFRDQLGGILGQALNLCGPPCTAASTQVVALDLRHKLVALIIPAQSLSFTSVCSLY